MDRRSITAVVAFLALFIGWDAYLNYRYPDRYAQPELAGEARPGQGQDPVSTPVPSLVETPVATASSAPPTPPARVVDFDACGVDAHFSTRGGVMRHAVLTNHQAAYVPQPLWSFLWDKVRGQAPGPWKPYGDEPGLEQLLTEDAQVLGMGTGPIGEATTPVDVLTQTDTELVLRGTTSEGIEVTRYLREVQGDPCTLDVTTTWRNLSGAPYKGSMWLQIHDIVPEKAGRYGNVVQPYAMVDGDYEYMNLKKLEHVEAFEGPVDWMALSDRYFAMVLVPSSDTAAGALSFSRLPRAEGEDAFGLHYVITTELAAGQVHSESFTMYTGPKELSVLRSLHEGLPKLVDLGWFSFFGKLLLAALKFFHLIVDQWGLAIIVLTLSVKALFFPLTHASFKSSQAMSALQPELQEIREKFKDTPEEMNKRTMQLFTERGVNPLGGCLPMLVQFPVWIALYQVLLNSVELYHTQFLYLRDLSSVDPYGALPAVVVVLMVVQQQFMPTGNMDPAQARMMKLMPLLFGFFFFTFPSGLVVYIFVNMVLTILQQWFIRRTYQQPVAAAATV